jgi:hypothetical protein
LRKIQQRIDHKSAVVENRTSGDDSSSFSAMSSPPNSESEESDGTQSSESEGEVTELDGSDSEDDEIKKNRVAISYSDAVGERSVHTECPSLPANVFQRWS